MAKGRIGDLLVSSCFKGRIRRRTIRDYQTGERQNSPHPFNVAPTSPQISSLRQIADYHLKASDKHFCWMAVNIPGLHPFLRP
ncbi:MAG: hypothetical protein MUP41_16270, partial [Desulfobacterales bacterium]|nr:hypothetical protein [Desulfobacterales bacterium]